MHDAVNGEVIFSSLGGVLFPSGRGAIRRRQAAPIGVSAGGRLDAAV